MPVGLHAQTEKPAPTYADVSYGPHERNVLDFWQAPTDRPAPLVIFIHGGAFQVFDKSRITAPVLQALLDAGISVAAINYRYITTDPLPSSFFDARRALQMLRAKAGEWRIDTSRIGAYGGSAGAQICMWLAFHDEMAESGSSDPITRQSTRLAAVASQGGPITMDRHWMEQSVPGNVVHTNMVWPNIFGVKTMDDLDRPEIQRWVRELSPILHLTADDPPIYMEFSMSPDDHIPTDPKTLQGWSMHHVIYGLTLQVRMRALGIESELRYPGASPQYRNIADFFIRQFTGTVR